jgi:hypothetical protein
MQEGMEQLNKREEEVQEKPLREVFNEWVKNEIEESEPSDASQLKIIQKNQKKIPDGDFKIFDMYMVKKDENLSWEDYEPLEKTILKELQEKEDNARRVFFSYFSEKVRPRVIRAEAEKQRLKDN